MTIPRTRIAILGAGPMGLETALYARTLGFPATVYEAQTVGHHLLSWGHVTLFTPWALNVSSLGRRRLEETGAPTGFDPDVLPTGHEVCNDYLMPLSKLPELAGTVREGHRVTAISRGDLLKGDAVGDPARGKEPFRLLIDAPGGEEAAEADIVIDAGGVYGQPNALGRGGVPAPGERALGKRIHTGLPDVRGRDRGQFEGRRVLVVGDGLSAATTVTALAGVAGAETFWVTRGGSPPVAEIPDDPLPARIGMAREANRLASADGGGCHHIPHSVVSGLRPREDAVAVTLASPSGDRTIEVDTIVSQTGFRPDHDIYRELQVHECYATEGPMKLAASLLEDGNADCMASTGFGPKSLTHPEPGFFIVGHKSYGRNPHFLLRTGREQIRDVFRILTGDGSLDLYRVSETSRV